jgi:hypothetical protein
MVLQRRNRVDAYRRDDRQSTLLHKVSESNFIVGKRQPVSRRAPVVSVAPDASIAARCLFEPLTISSRMNSINPVFPDSVENESKAAFRVRGFD